MKQSRPLTKHLSPPFYLFFSTDIHHGSIAQGGWCKQTFRKKSNFKNIFVFGLERHPPNVICTSTARRLGNCRHGNEVLSNLWEEKQIFWTDEPACIEMKIKQTVCLLVKYFCMMAKLTRGAGTKVFQGLGGVNHNMSLMSAASEISIQPADNLTTWLAGSDNVNSSTISLATADNVNNRQEVRMTSQ